MYYTAYHSPIGDITLAANQDALTGLWFNGQKYFGSNLPLQEIRELPVFKQTKRWLDIYFSGQEPDFTPVIQMIGSPFQLMVWKILCNIPYGLPVTYGEIARRIAEQRGLSHMSAQAVGNAVGHNKISIIIPCHRVVGANGNLTGYAGGVEKKRKLLMLENVDISGLFIPQKGTAL